MRTFIVKVRDEVPQLRNDSCHVGAAATQPLHERVRGRVCDIEAQRLDEWLVWEKRLFVAAAEEDVRALGVGAPAELCGQARLPDPRLSGNEHEPLVPAGGLFECFV